MENLNTLELSIVNRLSKKYPTAVVDENGVTLYHENLESNLNGYWVEAKDLQEGDVFLDANGELSTLVSTERIEFSESITVYNFTVEDNHNYFVLAEEGEQTSLLVHNAEYGQVVGYVNLGQYKGQYNLKDIQGIMNKILGDAGSKIQILLIDTNLSEDALKDNLGNRYGTGKIYGQYVQFRSKGIGLGYTPNRYVSDINIDMIRQEINKHKDIGDDVLNESDIIANILLHETLFHGLLGKNDSSYEKHTLFSTVSPVSKPVIIPPWQQKIIDGKF